MYQQFFMGVVESREDPLQLGRVRVRVFGVHTESLDDVPTTSLPWAIPLMPATSASVSGIGHSVSQYVEGTMVFMFFQDGESKQQPIILGSVPGIPQNKSPFGPNGTYQIESISDTTQNSDIPPVVVTVPVTSTAGTPVVDSSGTPVQTETPTTGLDISRMVAKYGSNVTKMYQACLDFGIRDEYAIAAILSNVAKECKYELKRGNLSYSTLSRVREIYPSRTKNLTDDELKKYLNNPEGLGNLVYANSEGNGNVNSGDGFKYRDGGYIQLTKKNNYKAVGDKIGVDLVANPELVIDPVIAPKVAAQYFINRFNGVNKLVFSSLDEAIRAITKKVNPGLFHIDYPIVTEASKLLTINKDPVKEAEKEIAKEVTQPNNPENDIDKNATKEQIDSGITSKTTTTSNLGFKDPNKKYPLTAFLKEPDSNRLSRRSTDKTLVEKKMQNRRETIKSVGGDFSEPKPAYNTKYPFNHVYSTESGHALEFDDTPGAERINLYHTSGTFSEIDVYGNQVNKIIGDNFSITERNGYIYVDGTARITVGGDVKLMVGGNLDISVDGNLNYDVGGDVTWKVGGSSKSGIGSEFSVQSGSGIAMDGSTINLNSGESEAISPNARSGTSNDYPVQTPESFLGSASLAIEEESEANVNAYIEKEIAKGTMTKKDIDDGKAAVEKPKAVDEAAPVNTPSQLPVSCAAFANKTDIPDNTQLSKNFNLGMLSSKAPAGHHKVRAQHGLSVPEIVCNLKKVAENCLDVIKAKYPNMFVSSGFRQGTSTSQHELGQAIDMQFNVPNSEYYDIAVWIKDNVLFDKLLLEYKTIETGRAWIHVSFKDSPRKEVYTYMNHGFAGNGLRKLQ